MIHFTGLTDVGRQRTDNQDTFIAKPLWRDTAALLVAIDGVGGYAGGDRAAAIAREAIKQYMATPSGDALAMLREAVVFANNQIDRERRSNDQFSQMCCVLTAAIADTGTGRLVFVHVGDTRLYRYRQGQLEKLTADHSMVGMREDAGHLTEAEAMNHPRRNEIMREVGLMPHRVDDDGFLDSGETDLQPGDALLLCSDGLTDMITRAQITGVLVKKQNLDNQATELVFLANEAGGNDNITVVLARWEGLTEVPLVAAPPSPRITAEVRLPNVPEPTHNVPTTRPANWKPWLIGGVLALLTGTVAWVVYQGQQPKPGGSAAGAVLRELNTPASTTPISTSTTSISATSALSGTPTSGSSNVPTSQTPIQH
jgi:PPM family protein phosphatase